MTDLTISMPDALQEWVNMRIAQESEDRLWLKAMIDEGLASGTLDQDPRDIIADIIAEDSDLRG